MFVYSTLLAVALLGGAPWWLARMATSGRYRAGLAGRLGFVPAALRAAIGAGGADACWMWLHAVSVGEVVAAVRLIEELQRRRPELRFAVSTTTKTGQELARQRLSSAAVFYMPLDLGFVVRRYLQAIRPVMLVLMESELWPNLIRECARMDVPVVVANARISDRSYPRYMRLRRIWRHVLEPVRLFLASSEETAERLRKILGEASGHPGVAERVIVVGNLKYDVRVTGTNALAELIRDTAAGRSIVVAGSTVQGRIRNEEEMVFEAMKDVWRERPETLLMLAPRHPDRFAYACSLGTEHGVRRASELMKGEPVPGWERQTVVLDTIGDLAAVYGVADVAFVGGSLVAAGGHNPLEAAQFGCPVVMGESVENFRGIVGAMVQADGIRMVRDARGLGAALVDLLSDRTQAQALGARGRRVFEAEAGATARTAEAIVACLAGGSAR